MLKLIFNKYNFLLILYINFLFILHVIAYVNQNEHPNILLFVVDDLRPALGCYSDSYAFTPNIDRIANEGIIFSKAFAQVSFLLRLNLNILIIEQFRMTRSHKSLSKVVSLICVLKPQIISTEQ